MYSINIDRDDSGRIVSIRFDGMLLGWLGCTVLGVSAFLALSELCK